MLSAILKQTTYYSTFAVEFEKHTLLHRLIFDKFEYMISLGHNLSFCTLVAQITITFYMAKFNPMSISFRRFYATAAK